MAVVSLHGRCSRQGKAFLALVEVLREKSGGNGGVGRCGSRVIRREVFRASHVGIGGILFFTDIAAVGATRLK